MRGGLRPAQGCPGRGRGHRRAVKAIRGAVEKDITNGTGGGKFSPEDSCTRGRIVTFLYRALAK
ncbi:MAG: S-layer homology domain-containing protein [Oscillospiraceae bacterium]|nr:S-layer homology domain-containing protein [Oscillospiraceae bacterium]